jgi:hypothetical protein
MSALHDRDPWPPPLSSDSSVSDVIAEFLQTTDLGVGRRELRAAISHVEAELGTMRIRAVRSRHVNAMLDGLRRAGLSSRRETAVLEALRSLFAFAVARRLIPVDPLGDAWRPRDDDDPPARAPQPVCSAPTPAQTASPTPTLTMLALGARVAFWTTWIVTVVFVLLVLALLVELA